jgi:hypothetical protein
MSLHSWRRGRIQQFSMNLFLDVGPVIVFGNYLVVYTCEPGLAPFILFKTYLKLKVSQPLLSEHLPTEKQQMLLCP